MKSILNLIMVFPQYTVESIHLVIIIFGVLWKCLPVRNTEKSILNI